MRHGSLFSGIGGFDLAAEWMGWENVFHCEWNEFGQKVLKYYWPNADSHIDICKTDFKKYANKIDILTGGFPCQPFSMAGKRKGTNDERYLWHEMLRAIQEIKPKFVIAENVYGITNIDGGLVFEQVCIDLETEGYEVQPFIIPAAAKDAPHRRDRCWFVATNSTSNGRQEYTRSMGCEIREKESRRHQFANGLVYNGKKRYATDAECFRLEHSTTPTQVSRKEKNSNGERSKSTLFTKTNDNGHKSNWNNFPTQSPICSGNDGFSSELDGITFSKWRNESIKGYGNAIVPQVAVAIFKALILSVNSPHGTRETTR